MTKVLKEHAPSFVWTCLIAGTILTILAPYGTLRMTLLSRAVFWVGLCAAGGLGAATVTYICHKRSITLGPVAMTLWQSLNATIFVSGFLISLNYILYGGTSLKEVLVAIFYVWVIAVTLSAIGNLIGRRQTVTPDKPTRPALYERLKPNLRSADIFALSAEDHYVRVHTSKGDDLILMRLSDAILEVDPIEGLTPHRSWWVAETGVKSVTRKDGKTVLILHTDMTVPVSRNRNKDLKDAGWV